ncbi:hypothetical protein WEN_02235 [Mycoplasma wenyonii str. Massachusetts]|uniref:Uncharacterized protein n=1 Tax=Mycoplasma wenyonii (strain Massachusetts) TaxID=1197325 RepID=I6YLP5_MYCWM|nr:hypothetical protein [Mycoplasma wenyonii]AFN65234.1 hypothetical protein WEN_02235 [Mycoplasma wenyonii str. Massachusetts]
MESTTQSRTLFPFSLLLSPFIALFFLGFTLSSWKHRFGYKGNKDYSSRYLFFKKVYWTFTQLTFKKEVLESYNLLNRKDTFICIYCKRINWTLLSLAFLLTNYYQKAYQKTRAFKFCVLSESKPKWWFLLSLLDPLSQLPNSKFLKEFDCPVICFSSSINKLKRFALKSYKTMVFFRFEQFFSWKTGFLNTFRAIGKIDYNELLKNASKAELKLVEILKSF